MKILQVLPALNSGGVERGTLEIAEAIVRAGHTSVVLSAGGRLVTELESAGSRHVSWDLGRKNPLLLLQVRKLRRWLLSERFDIIHLRSRLPAWMIWLAWRRLPEGQRPHLVTTVHGLHSVSRYSAIMTCGERIIVVSETARRYVLDNYPKADPARIRLIYRGIDPAAFPRQYTPDVEWRADWYATFPSLKNRFVVTLPGRMTRLKGHLDFLRMLVLLREEIPGLRGLIVGGEDPKRRAYAQEVRQAVRDMGLSDIVVFAGHRSDIRDIYAVSDVVVSLSSKPESFGRTVLEPLAMGVPVVGYAHGGVAEILAALFPEGAVPTGDVQSAAQAVMRVARLETGPVRPNDQFLLRQLQTQTLAVYKELTKA